MTDGSHIPIITIVVGLNISYKTNSDSIFKTHLKHADIYRLKVKGWKMTYQEKIVTRRNPS